MKTVKYQYEFLKAIAKCNDGGRKAPFTFCEEGFIWSTFDGCMLAAVHENEWWLDSDKINRGASESRFSLAKFVDMNGYTLGYFDCEKIHTFVDDKGREKQTRVAMVSADDGRHGYINPKMLEYFENYAIYVPEKINQPIMIKEEFLGIYRPMGFIWQIRCPELENNH